MKKDGRKGGWIGAAGLVGVLVLALAWDRGTAGRALQPGPLSRELSDRAVDCLATGEVRPTLAELSEADLGSIVAIVARLIGAYERADFASFLALRAGDVPGVAERRAGDLESLRALARELRVPEKELDADLIGVLECFWDAYYDGTPVARFAPEETRIELHGDGLGGRSLESWEESFVALCNRVPGPWIRHELVVPHRRNIERVACDAGPLRWLDLELGFETREGSRARLVARFVWDGALREWYLHDAASVYAVGDRSQRHLIL
jgi:hypothetical protein